MTENSEKGFRLGSLNYAVFVAASIVYTAAVLVLFLIAQLNGSEFDHASSITMTFLVLWMVVPVTGYLDVRRFRGTESTWQPRVRLWVLGFLVPFISLSTACTYILRRHERGSGEGYWCFWWKTAFIAVAAVLLTRLGWTALPDLTGSDDFVTVSMPINILTLLVSTVLVPAAVRYDIGYVRRNHEWSPELSLWVTATAIWFLNIVTVPAYVVKRRAEMKAEEPVTKKVEESRSEGSLEFYLFILSAFLFTIPPFLLNLTPSNLDVALAIFFAAGSLGLPVTGYLDIRKLRSLDVDWSPKTWFWVISFFVPMWNLGAASAYSIRRYGVMDLGSLDNWYTLATLGVIAQLNSLVLSSAMEHGYISRNQAILDAFTFVFVATVIFVPTAVFYDIQYVRRNYSWEPDTWVWVTASAVPLLNVFALISYASKREPGTKRSVVESEGESGGSDEGKDESDIHGSDSEVEAQAKPEMGAGEVEYTGSKAWYLPGATTLLSVLFVVLLAPYSIHGYLAGVFYLTLLLLILVSWLSLFAIIVDARKLREQGADWQPTEFVYIFAGLIFTPPVGSVLYVIQRHRHLDV